MLVQKIKGKLSNHIKNKIIRIYKVVALINCFEIRLWKSLELTFDYLTIKVLQRNNMHNVMLGLQERAATYIDD